MQCSATAVRTVSSMWARVFLLLSALAAASAASAEAVEATAPFALSSASVCSETGVDMPKSARSDSANAEATTVTLTTVGIQPFSAYGHVVCLKATVRASSGQTPTGSILFKDGVTALQSVALDSSGVAILVLPALTVGRHEFTAVYPGLNTFAGATSPALWYSVTLATTTMAMTASRTSTRHGDPVTFTAIVTADSGGIPPGGMIVFERGASVLARVAMDGNGKTVFTTTSLPLGDNLIYARFLGSSTHAWSAAWARIDIGLAGSATLLSVSPNPVQSGQSVTLAASVAPSAGGGGTPAGYVLFRRSGDVLATVPLSGGVASYSASGWPEGGHLLSASYLGSAPFEASDSQIKPLTVQQSCSDALGDATIFGGNTGARGGSSAGATAEAGEPDHAGTSIPLNSVWCRWQAPASGTVTMETTGSQFDTTLAIYKGSTASTLTPVASNDNIAQGTVQSRVTFRAEQGEVYAIAIDGAGVAVGNYVFTWNIAPVGSTVFASILPTSRSVLNGTPATVFATVANGGSIPLYICSIWVPPGFPAAIAFQAIDSANAFTLGDWNVPATIPPGGTQNFVVGITPTAVLNAAEIALDFTCNSQRVANVSGLNTLTLSSASTPTPDILAIVSTPSNDGIVTVPQSGTGFFAAAAVNIGATGYVTASVDDSGAHLPIAISLCRSDRQTGACIGGPPAASIGRLSLATNEVVTIAVFVTSTAPVPFSPGVNRLQLRLKTDDGVTRGSASVAIRTQ